MVASGTLGMIADLPFGLITGFNASATVKTDMVYNGNARMSGSDRASDLKRLTFPHPSRASARNEKTDARSSW